VSNSCDRSASSSRMNKPLMILIDLDFVLDSVSGGGENQFILLALARFFTPLQGLFNIIVYCRPHIIALKKRHPEYSLLKAFWLIVRTGGDNNSSGQTKRQRKSNLQGNAVFLQRLEGDHVKRMQSIHQSSRESSDKYAALRIYDSDDGESGDNNRLFDDAGQPSAIEKVADLEMGSSVLFIHSS